MRFSLLLIPAALMLAQPASASVIFGPTGFSNVTGFGFVNTVITGNDNAPGTTSPNLIVINESATQVLTQMAVSFNVDDRLNNQSTGPTEYNVIKNVTNNTADPWSAFSLSLIQFLFPSPPGNTYVVAFDQDSIPYLSGGGVSGQAISFTSPNSILWTGLNVLPGQTLSVNFALDTCPSCLGIFQILQVATPGQSTPEVPEPALTALVGAALFAIGVYRRRR